MMEKPWYMALGALALFSGLSHGEMDLVNNTEGDKLAQSAEIHADTDVFSANQLEEEKELILGVRDNDFKVRADLVPVIVDLARNNDDIREQLIVHSRAHDWFMTAETPQQAYDAFLLMKAAQYCMSEMGLGQNGARNMLIKLTHKQINTDYRKTVVGRAEQLFNQKNFPSLEIYDDKSEYCRYTSTNPIYNKSIKVEEQPKPVQVIIEEAMPVNESSNIDTDLPKSELDSPVDLSRDQYFDPSVPVPVNIDKSVKPIE